MNDLDRHCQSRRSVRTLATSELRALVEAIYWQQIVPIDPWIRKRQAQLLKAFADLPGHDSGLEDQQRAALLELAGEMCPPRREGWPAPGW